MAVDGNRCYTYRLSILSGRGPGVPAPQGVAVTEWLR